MEPHKDKIPSPFEAPEGYFDGFEAKLAERMTSKGGKKGELTVTHKRGFKLEWVAVAAAVIALLVTAWFIFVPKFQQHEMVKNPVPVKVEIPVMPKEVLPDTIQLQKTETAVLESVLDDADKITPAAQVRNEQVLTPQDITVAQELEDEGLIVSDIEDGLFDQIEIMP